MNTTKHTPGPWTVRAESNDNEAYVKTAEGEHLLTVDFSPTLANARLIASAPDLLEALQVIIAADNDGETHDEEGNPTLQWIESITQAKKAIAKAIGTN